VYFRLGVRNEPKGCVAGLHHPEFALDEDALALGAATLVRAAQRFLNGS
jgi:amidohydrolase